MMQPDGRKVIPKKCGHCGKPNHCIDKDSGHGLCCWGKAPLVDPPAIDVPDPVLDTLADAVCAGMVESVDGISKLYDPEYVKQAEDEYCAAFGKPITMDAFRNVRLNSAVHDFIRKVANTANWKAHNQTERLVLWDAHPELWKTAARLLRSIDGEEER